jgi:restriction system protein
MARKKDSLADLLVLLPWWVSLALAVVVYGILQGIYPALAPIAGLVFLAAAVASAIRSLETRTALETQTSLDSLREIPWKQFEDLVAEVYRRKGFSVEENLGKGPDGGIDLVLHKGGRKTLVQCKRWKGKPVGAPIIRELYGLMAAEGADAGKLVATTTFSPDAESFAGGKGIELVDGKALLALVGEVQRSGQVTASASAGVAESSERACPSCGRPMVLRTAKRGANAGNQFWGCSGYPNCKATRSA